MTFRNALTAVNNVTRTENGMTALKSSLNPVVDLFFAIGASRGRDITSMFNDALSHNRELALRCLLWARDAREGSGERQTFRTLIQHLEKTDDAALLHVLPLVPELGRWDDLLVLQTPQWKSFAYGMIGDALSKGNGLCAKWMPRKGAEANNLRNYFGLSPKQYRKGLVALSNTVEQKMCAKDWDSINFEQVPSVAAARYKRAFTRNAPVAYQAYANKVVAGTAKINASAIYPYDVLKDFQYGGGAKVELVEAQWKALPNWMSGDNKIIPMIDVSSSMSIAQVAGTTNALQVAISLGLYIADKQEGDFKDMFLTFSNRAVLDIAKGTLYQKYQQIAGSQWDMSTNVEAGFDEILRVAKSRNVAPTDMPKFLLILSDMQFNSATGRSSDTAFTMAQRKYEAAGYELPKIIFWNLAARGNNTPVEFNQNGVALVSGYSPSLLQSILGAKNVSPEDIMLETLMKDRYNLA